LVRHLRWSVLRTGLISTSNEVANTGLLTAEGRRARGRAPATPSCAALLRQSTSSLAVGRLSGSSRRQEAMRAATVSEHSSGTLHRQTTSAVRWRTTGGTCWRRPDSCILCVRRPRTTGCAHVRVHWERRPGAQTQTGSHGLSPEPRCYCMRPPGGRVHQTVACVQSQAAHLTVRSFPRAGTSPVQISHRMTPKL
jgi:hypothetical protein